MDHKSRLMSFLQFLPDVMGLEAFVKEMALKEIVAIITELRKKKKRKIFDQNKLKYQEEIRKRYLKSSTSAMPVETKESVEADLIPKDWPPLEECLQYREGMLRAAMYHYPWEDDDYEFNFDAFYPPPPDGPPWLLKLLEVTKHMVRPQPLPRIGKEDMELCPVCCPHVDLGTDPNPNPLIKKYNIYIYPEIGEHPVWDMNPIPIPFHILDHFFGPPGTTSQCPRIVTPEQLENTKKFVKELRDTRGYHVKSFPHEGLIPSTIYFYESDLELEVNCSVNGKMTFLKFVEKGLQCVIDYISSKTSKSYQLVKVLKVITTMHMFLVTFDAAASTAAPETFIASVKSLHPSAQKPSIFKATKSNPNILECLLLPGYAAPYKTEPCPLGYF